MRTLAVSLLLFAAVVYLADPRHTDGFLGYVNAGAEASMVGAIADWFAVTALFKHPLGLPIPHTALIPRRKDELGRSLEEFVGENFLQEDDHPRAARRRPAEQPGRRLADRGGATPAGSSTRRADLLHLGLPRIRDEDIVALVEEALLPRFLAEPISPVAGSLLEEIVRDGAHHGLVDLALEEAHRWLTQNEETFVEIVRGAGALVVAGGASTTGSPTGCTSRWSPGSRTSATTPYHHARARPGQRCCAQLADDLLHDPATQERMERLKDRVLEPPAAAGHRDLAVERLPPGAARVARRPRGAAARAGRVDELARVRRAARPRRRRCATRLDALRRRPRGVRASDRYGDELTAVITHTIDRWDGKEAARKIELHVGRDLQFIRINGTIVGGLVGVVIHAVERAALTPGGAQLRGPAGSQQVVALARTVTLSQSASPRSEPSTVTRPRLSAECRTP